MTRPKKKLGRPPKPEEEKVGHMLALRLSEEDKRMLDELVRRRGERLAAEGVAATASSVIRSLIRQAAREERIEIASARPRKNA